MNKMNNASPKIATKLRKNRLMANLSVCEYQPSVCSCNPVNEPFVGKIIPNTRLGLAARQIHGFTLIELIITMTVVAILMAVAVPNLRMFVQNGRIATNVNDLIADVNFARSEAIKRSSFVAICRSTNGTGCTGGNWRDGRLIFVDADNDGILDAGETVFRFREALGGADSTLNTATGPDPLVFGPRGGANIVAPVNYTFCDMRGPVNGRRMTLTPVGQLSVSQVLPVACDGT